jgi:demethylmenaquinone methyltransferase/2-methoxy-6-polyprenyl-1,4-benzoquinol methylase
MERNTLYEQIAYYRARAQEYDESLAAAEDLQGTFALARELLWQLGPYEQVAELACGTGIWTQALLQISGHITAIDAAPEMLAIARQKTQEARVSYQQTDLFQWKPEHSYDLVFFANWLSHVPPGKLAAFLRSVSHAVGTGGSLVIIDQFAPMPEDQQIMKQGQEGYIYAERALGNGDVFTIIKAFYDLPMLQEMLTALHFAVTVSRLSDVFFFLCAKKVATGESGASQN